MGTMEELLEGEGASPNEVGAEVGAKDTAQVTFPFAEAGEAPSAEGALEFKKIEVSGIAIEGETISDGLGNTWQVPALNTEDFDDLYAGDVYKVPKSILDVFHVQMVPVSRLTEYRMRQFVPVTLNELGIPAELALTSGSPLDGYHVVGDSVMVKIPRVIFDRIQERKNKEARRRREEMEPTKEMIRKAEESGIMSRVTRQTSATLVDPNNRLGLGLEEKK
jgi:hypothetical protein